jgi:hypothetical protein
LGILSFELVRAFHLRERNIDVDSGRYRLTEAHSLSPLELAERAIEGTFQGNRIA